MSAELDLLEHYWSGFFSKFGPWLAAQPELCIFLAVGLGYFVGQRKLGPVQLGGVCGTLLVALLLGQSGVAVNADVKNFFFALFIFALGYAGGPHFFASLNAKGLRLGLMSIIEVGLVLGLALTAMRLFSFDAGTTAGLVAGAATESAVIGTASEAISRLPAAPAQVLDLQARVATAYSLTYIFGLITIVIFTSQLAPLLLRVNLREEAARLWNGLGGDQADKDQDAGLSEISGRVYYVSAAAGRTVAQVRQMLEPEARVEKLSRRSRQLTLKDELKLKHGDLLLVVGRRSKLIAAAGLIGEERPVHQNLNLSVETEEYRVGRGAAGLTLAAFHEKIKENGLGEHVHLSRLLRSGQALPLLPQLTLEAGDSLFIYGPPPAAAKVGQLAGRAVRRGGYTNFAYLGLGIVLGILIGRLTVPLGGINLSLGTGGGALLTGLVFGWLQNRKSVIPM